MAGDEGVCSSVVTDVVVGVPERTTVGVGNALGVADIIGPADHPLLDFALTVVEIGLAVVVEIDAGRV